MFRWGSLVLLISLSLAPSRSALASDNSEEPVLQQDTARLIAGNLESQAFGLKASVWLEPEDIRLFSEQFAETYFDPALARSEDRVVVVETTDGIIVELRDHLAQFPHDQNDLLLQEIQTALEDKLAEIEGREDFQASQAFQQQRALYAGLVPVGLTGLAIVLKVGVWDLPKSMLMKHKARKLKRAVRKGKRETSLACIKSLKKYREFKNTHPRSKRLKNLAKLLGAALVAGVPTGLGSWFWYYEDRHLYDAQEDAINEQWPELTQPAAASE